MTQMSGDNTQTLVGDTVTSIQTEGIHILGSRTHFIDNTVIDERTSIKVYLNTVTITLLLYLLVPKQLQTV